MPTRAIATQIVKKIVDAGYIAYFAGGWVRDNLMGHPSDDIDIATSAPLEVVTSLFPKTIALGVSFGIVVVVEEGHPFEVATFRKDIDYVDGRRPTRVESATPEEDAQRRDFTINGMFYDPLKERLYDFVDGQKDISLQRICAIGDPTRRFAEDRLRMMRAARYATRFDFTIEPQTLRAIQVHAHTLLASVAIERVWQEFKKMAQFNKCAEGLVLLHRLCLLSTIFPILKDVSIEEIQRRVIRVNHFPKDVPTVALLLELFPDFSVKEALEFCDTFKLSNQDKQFVQFYYEARHMLMMPEEWQDQLENIEWVRFYAHALHDLCMDMIATYYPDEKKRLFFQMHTARKKYLEQDIQRLVLKKPLVSAHMLTSAGISPGPSLGILLREAERIAANFHLDDADEVLTFLRASPLWPPSAF